MKARAAIGYYTVYVLSQLVICVSRVLYCCVYIVCLLSLLLLLTVCIVYMHDYIIYIC